MGIPEENIFARATGPAADIVTAHQDPQELVFYSGWFCPFVQRTWIALEEKHIPYQYKEVNPYKKEPSFLAINPKGLVPVIEYHGKAIYESQILCEFLEDAYPTHTPHLLPNDPIDKANAKIWIDHITKSFLPPYFHLLQSQEISAQDKAREEVYAALRKLMNEIKGPYFSGEEFNMVDVMIAPFIMRDWVIREHRGFSREGVGEEWAMYAMEVEGRESVWRTMSVKENYVDIYGRYLRNEAQSQAAKAIREGRALP
ncbi:thioredoxin-like protein [Cyathus striatus]|nr:thioredoxin-like protein [Cyathus striatus]